MRKFELADGSSGVKWRTWWSRWSYYSALSPGASEVLKPGRSSDTRFARAVSNPMLKTSCWCSLGRNLGTDGVRSQNRKITRLDEDEKLAELTFSSDKKSIGKPLRGGLYESLGCLFGLS